MNSNLITFLAGLAGCLRDGAAYFDLQFFYGVGRSMGRRLDHFEVDLLRRAYCDSGVALFGIEFHCVGASLTPQSLIKTKGFVVSYSALKEKRDRSESRTHL